MIDKERIPGGGLEDDILDGDGELDGLVQMPRILLDLANGHLQGSEIDTVVEWLQASEEAPPPPWAVNRAVRIGRKVEDGQEARTAIWRRLIAALVYDTRVHPRAAGARAVAGDELRLMYQAGGIEIDLEVTDGGIAGRLRLLGQVTAEPPDLTRAWVAAEGPAGRVEGEIDELGQFALDGLVTGRHRMEIGLTYELIEIPEVQI